MHVGPPPTHTPHTHGGRACVQVSRQIDGREVVPGLLTINGVPAPPLPAHAPPAPGQPPHPPPTSSAASPASPVTDGGSGER
eukprot:COSAG01_NODE_2543_length_7429_cov_6.011122_4_plen_82_part_00